MTLKDITSLHKAIVSSGHCETLEEADIIVHQMSNAMHFEGEDPDELLSQYGLEPDYIFDILKS